MTDHDHHTLAVLGAGPGIGASVADRFARAGHSVGLVARNAPRLLDLAASIRTSRGVPCEVATADLTRPDDVRRALDAIAATLGPVTALCFSPLPDVGLIRPVLETSAEDFMASLQLNIAGAAAAVEHVLPGMLERGEGSLLFTTGSAALHPDPERAASAVTTTAAAAYLALLHRALDGTGVRVGHTVVVGAVDRDSADAHHPDHVAADLWAHHTGAAGSFPSVLRLPGATR